MFTIMLLVEAVCQNLGIGDHTIDIRTLACYYAQAYTAHFHTGWNSGMRMHIEEIRQAARLDAGKTAKETFKYDVKICLNQEMWEENNLQNEY